ncbi:unnamed protein product [Alternaria alternata]
MQLPKTQKAAIKQGTGDSATTTIKEIPILVKINYTGLCASDKSLLHDEWDFKMAECTNGIAGHEGAGTVVAVGSNVQDLWQIGNRAGIKWIASVCRKCEFCTNGQDECHCPKQLNSGFTIAGTFQEYALTDARPRSLRTSNTPNIWACASLQLTAETPNASSASLGAEKFIDYTTCSDITSEIMKITTYGAHGVIVFAATRAGYEQAPHLLRPNGTMVCVGLPKDNTIVVGASPIVMCLKKLNVVGSVVGTLKDVEEALDFTARGLVHPILTHGGLEDIDRFCADMNAGKLAGRAVIKMTA